MNLHLAFISQHDDIHRQSTSIKYQLQGMGVYIDGLESYICDIATRAFETRSSLHMKREQSPYTKPIDVFYQPSCVKVYYNLPWAANSPGQLSKLFNIAIKFIISSDPKVDPLVGFSARLKQKTKNIRQPIKKIENYVHREIHFLKRLHSFPDIPKIEAYHTYLGTTNKYPQKKTVFYQELCEQDLECLLKKFKHSRVFTERGLLYLFYTLLRGLSDIHGQGIVHADIKTANIFLKYDPVFKEYKGLLGDFGLSYDQDEKISKLRGTKNYFSYHKIMCCCSPQLDSEYFDGFAEDMWALGIVFYQLVYGKPTHWEQVISFFSLVKKYNELSNALKKSGIEEENPERKKLKKQLSFLESKLTEENSVLKFLMKGLGDGAEPPESHFFSFLIWNMLQSDPKKRITAKAAFEKISHYLQRRPYLNLLTNSQQPPLCLDSTF